jgi:predicted enzyme related to lactoylglutathione lyase
MNNPVGWFEIYVQDMERAKQFYQSVLSTKLTKLEGSSESPELWTFPRDREGSGASGALAKMPGFRSGANSVLVYFSCADCAVEADRAVKAGGKIHMPKRSIGQYGHIALIIDPEGNMVGLHSMK